MLTIMELPQSDPSVQRIVKSLWVGHKKITLDTEAQVCYTVFVGSQKEMRNVSNADTGRVDDDGGQAETELQSVMEGAAGVEGLELRRPHPLR